MAFHRHPDCRNVITICTGASRESHYEHPSCILSFEIYHSHAQQDHDHLSRMLHHRSFNFTKMEEEKNAENILVMVIRRNPDLTARYIGNFDWHLRHSEVYQGRGG